MIRKVTKKDKRMNTGFSQLDAITGGLACGDVTVIAARPKMECSSLVLGIARRVCTQNPGTVLVITPHENQWEMDARLLQAGLDMSMAQFFNGRIPPNEAKAQFARLADEQKGKIQIYAMSPFFLGDVAAICRDIPDLAMVVVDDLAGLSQWSSTPQATWKKIPLSRSLRALKQLAQRRNVPVIATVKLDRMVEERFDKRPLRHDLQRIGMPQDGADQILLLYRDSYYVSQSPMGDTAECTVVKNRHGGVGTALLSFDPYRQSFNDKE